MTAFLDGLRVQDDDASNRKIRYDDGIQFIHTDYIKMSL
jgi:hypothetical protein